jgi:hypothetical protein
MTALPALLALLAQEFGASGNFELVPNVSLVN